MWTSTKSQFKNEKVNNFLKRSNSADPNPNWNCKVNPHIPAQMTRHAQMQLLQPDTNDKTLI